MTCLKWAKETTSISIPLQMKQHCNDGRNYGGGAAVRAFAEERCGAIVPYLFERFGTTGCSSSRNPRLNATRDSVSQKRNPKVEARDDEERGKYTGEKRKKCVEDGVKSGVEGATEGEKRRAEGLIIN